MRVALAAVGQPPPLAALHDLFDDPLDDAFDDPLGDERSALRRRLREQLGGPLFGRLVLAEKARYEAARCTFLPNRATFTIE